MRKPDDKRRDSSFLHYVGTIGVLELAGIATALLCTSLTFACAVSGTTGDDATVVDLDAWTGDVGPDPSLCGNGIIDPGEVCDDGLPPGQSVCSEDCMRNDGPCTKDEDCFVECHYCGPTGHCTMAEFGTDPKDDCPEEPPESCGLTGYCNGKGKCSIYDSTTVCGEGRCQGSVVHMTRFCDGQGNCSKAETLDCGPDECVLHNAPGSGTVCGTGTPVVLKNNDVIPATHTFRGNLLHSGGFNWYRVGAVADEGSLAVYAWFESNPSDEFAFEVRSGTGNVDDCSDGELQCTDDSPYIRYSYLFNQCSPSCNELGRNIYIGVRRAPGAVPTCGEYSLKVRVGGYSPPW